MRVLITGVTGLVGSHLARFLIQKKVTVWGMKRFRSSLKNVKDLQKISLISGDVLDRSSVEEAVSQADPEVIFHLAAQSYPSVSWEAPAYTLETNLMGTLNVLEAARRRSRPPKVFLACSSAQYGITQKTPLTEDQLQRPTSPYAVSKLAMEALGYQYFVSYQLPVYLGRYFIQVGVGQDEQTSIQAFCKQVAAIEKGRQEPVIRVGNLKPQRDFLDVRDGVRATWAVVQKGKPGVAYNICSGKSPTMREVLNLILKKSPQKITVAVDSKRLRPVDEPIIRGDHRRLTAQTGWKPEIMLEETIGWVLNDWRERE